MAVDDQSEITFSISQGILPWQPFFVAGRKRLVAQPAGLTLGFAMHLASFSRDKANEYSTI